MVGFQKVFFSFTRQLYCRRRHLYLPNLLICNQESEGEQCRWLISMGAGSELMLCDFPVLLLAQFMPAWKVVS